MLAVHSMYIHSNIVKLDRLIKEQKSLPEQDSNLVTGHLDDLIEIRWDLDHIKFRFDLYTLKEILKEFDCVYVSVFEDNENGAEVMTGY